MAHENNFDYKFTFDYNRTELIIEDRHGEKDIWGADRFLNKAGNVIGSYGASWRLAVLNYTLFVGYPFVEGNHYNIAAHFRFFVKSNLTKVIGHLNRNLGKNYPFLHLDRKSFRLGSEVNQYRIEWVIDCNDDDILKDLCIDRNMQSINKQSLIDKLIKPNDRSSSTNEMGISIVNEGPFYTVTPADDVILWNDRAIKKAIDQYNGRIKKIDDELLPEVTVAGTSFDNLPDYICKEYIQIPRRTKKGASFAVVEAGAGAGKTYSLYATAKALMKKGHIAIVVELFELFSKSGKQSLLEYLGQFLTGNNGGETEILFRDLLGNEKNINGNEKTVFIIDGIDEIPLSKYPRLALELDALARIENPNVYFILGTRNAAAFTQNSGIEKGITAFARWDNIKLNPLSLDILSENEAQLYRILEKNKDTRTPLFVTCFREIQSLRDVVLSDPNRSFNFKQYIGDNIDIIDGIKDFDNYYDLFNLKTALLIAHAVKDKVHPIWYSDVLPCVAYYLYTNGENSISISTLEKLFGNTFNTINDGVYLWYRRAIIEKYGAFRSLFSKEKISWLLSTGFVRCIEDSTLFKFEHLEYMQFLAAKFASIVIREADDVSIRNAVISDVIRMTSFFDEDGVKRDDKMRNIPFAHYIVRDVSRNGQSLHPSIVRGRKDEKYKICAEFDPGYFRIIANVMYEKIDLYDEAKDLIDIFMRYKRGVIIANAEKIDDFEDWRLVYSANVILYSMITKRADAPDKLEMLNSIYKNLSNCAAIVSREAFASLGQQRVFSLRSSSEGFSWNKDFNIANIEHLTKVANERAAMPDYFGDYKADTLSMLYSNLGATQQEMAKHVHRHPDTVNALHETDYLNNAIDYHTHTLNFRKAIVDKISDPESVSIIRSYITLGTDEYYAGDFANAYQTAKEHLEKAVRNYHNKALERQGIDPEKIPTFNYDIRYPDNRTKPVLEIPHPDAEPNVICLRAAGAYYLLYCRTKQEYGKKVNELSFETTEKLKTEMLIQLNNQFDYLKAAYLFTVEECESISEDKKTRILDTVKLEINASEIDNLMRDVEKRYIHSFAHLGEKKAAGRELIEKIYTLYKALHIYSNKKLCWTDEWDN